MGAIMLALPRVAWLKNPLNERQQWRTVWNRGKKQKGLVGKSLSKMGAPDLPVVVTITRVSAGTLDDDGLAASCKHVRDAVAEWLGCGDGPTDPVKWEYAQQRGKKGTQSLIIEWRRDDAD